MKSLLFTLFLLSIQFSYAQIDNKSNIFKSILFETNIEESHYVKTGNLFPDIIKLEIKDLKNNSEGKFSVNPENEKYFKSDFTKNDTSILKGDDIKKLSNLKTDNIAASVNKTLVNKIIRKKLAEEIKNYIILNEALSYGDRNLEHYKNYNEIENLLIQTYQIDVDVELQIGKDIYPYLNKILKTELDKTLQNSINLLAINF